VSRKTLNLGILAHVDAGKTTLTERLLYAAGVIDEIGSVDDGTTQTDSLALERQRGITIKSAVVSFAIDDVTVNLIDTPGHPDFIAEVERVLAVLDGAVLVVSAVEGVQAQTPLLMRALQRLHVPTLVFVNKIDRRGADCERLLTGISERLTPAIVPMGSARAGTRAAEFTPWGAADAAFTEGLVSVVTEHDDALLAAYVNDEAGVPYRRLRVELAAQTKRALVHPLFFGSAITGAGVESLMAGITELLPADEGDGEGPLSGTVFKVERGRSGEKIAYVRMFSGTLRTRDRVRGRGEHEQKVTAISVFEDGSAIRRSSVAAGQIAQVWGLGDGQIGDAIGVRRGRADAHGFSPPTLETVVVPRDPGDKGALYAALGQLAEQDPLINLRQDDLRQELFLSIYGEVQKEVIQATLANEFGLDVEFRETTTICIERPIDTGAAVERLRQEPNPFLATVGLRIDPAASGSGVTFARARDVLGTMPFAFFKAVEETVQRTLREGIHGWQVTDCTVTMTHSGYLPRQSHAHQGFAKEMSSTGEDFRGLTPLVLMSALKQAGTVVCEPIHRFRLEFPADVLAAIWPALTRLGAVAQTPSLQGTRGILEGEIQAAHMHELQQQLRALTRGEGVLELAFQRYEPVRGATPAPARPRTDHNPLNRKEYLLHLARRLPGG
jgi:ribosomal protection tetracycline resistance protein